MNVSLKLPGKDYMPFAWLTRAEIGRHANNHGFARSGLQESYALVCYKLKQAQSYTVMLHHHVSRIASSVAAGQLQ